MESESIRKMKIPFFCFECIVLLKRRLDRIAIDKWTVVKLLVSLLPKFMITCTFENIEQETPKVQNKSYRVSHASSEIVFGE